MHKTFLAEISDKAFSGFKFNTPDKIMLSLPQPPPRKYKLHSTVVL